MRQDRPLASGFHRPWFACKRAIALLTTSIITGSLAGGILLPRTQAVPSTSNLNSSPSTGPTSEFISDAPVPFINENPRPHRGHFNLAILQENVSLPEVIARVSLKYKRPSVYLGERLVGDFRYRMNQRAQFIRGLNPGDRVVVRLFDPVGNFLGYSEFELLEENASVNLVLSDNPLGDRLIRTVIGIDADRDGQIDPGVQVYDYFTQTAPSETQDETAQVTFYRTTSRADLGKFAVTTLPRPSRAGVYPLSFQNGAFAVVNRTFYAFSPGLATAIAAAPGQIVQPISINSGQTLTTYEVSRLLLAHQDVGFSDEVIITTCDVGCVDSLPAAREAETEAEEDRLN